jgi:hypothetical protein
MKSPSLDKLYTQINKHILLAQSYTEIPELSVIIKGCRFKPYDYIFAQRSSKTILYRWWFDEFGNSLKIKDKKIQIIHNDLSLDRDKIVCTDVYYGLSLSQIIKISKMIYLCVGTDEDSQRQNYFLTLMGIDNYLRSYMYLYDEWQQVSSLLLGMSKLKMLASHSDLQYFRKLSNVENCPIPCLKPQEWLSMLPAPESFLDVIKKNCEKLLPYFKKE